MKNENNFAAKYKKSSPTISPTFPCGSPNVVSVHRRELGDLPVSPTGDYDFLISLRPQVTTSSAVR